MSEAGYRIVNEAGASGYYFLLFTFSVLPIDSLKLTNYLKSLFVKYFK
jgi:hypothetical protein